MCTLKCDMHITDAFHVSRLIASLRTTLIHASVWCALWLTKSGSHNYTLVRTHTPVALVLKSHSTVLSLMVPLSTPEVAGCP
jgi:hypothetical protein